MASRRVFVGIVPAWRHMPPSLSTLSTTTTFLPSFAAAMAPFCPAGPLPMTARSNFNGGTQDPSRVSHSIGSGAGGLQRKRIHDAAGRHREENLDARNVVRRDREEVAIEDDEVGLLPLVDRTSPVRVPRCPRGIEGETS